MKRNWSDANEKRDSGCRILTLAETVKAVELAGGLELARRRLCPSQYREAATTAPQPQGDSK